MPRKPQADFEKVEAAVFTEFRRTGDVAGMLAFADLCGESGDDKYEGLLRLVGDPPAMYRDLRRDDFAAVRWFLDQCRTSNPTRQALQISARYAWAETRAVRNELTGQWRFEWRRDEEGRSGAIEWACFLEWRLPGNAWSLLTSLHPIDIGDNGRVPAGPLHEITWGVPYGPDPYCRVVMAQLAGENTEFPHELST